MLVGKSRSNNLYRLLFRDTFSYFYPLKGLYKVDDRYLTGSKIFNDYFMRFMYEERLILCSGHPTTYFMNCFKDVYGTLVRYKKENGKYVYYYSDEQMPIPCKEDDHIYGF